MYISVIQGFSAYFLINRDHVSACNYKIKLSVSILKSFSEWIIKAFTCDPMLFSSTVEYLRDRNYGNAIRMFCSLIF